MKYACNATYVKGPKEQRRNMDIYQLKEAEITPWDTLCIDMIGPYNLNKKGSKPCMLWALTMIDLVTGWFEIATVDTKWADVIANVLEQTWLTRYPWPTCIVLDRGHGVYGRMHHYVRK